MGKSLIIAVIASIAGISLLSLSTSRSLFDSQENVSRHQQDLLAREIAHTAQNLAMRKLQSSYNWRTGYQDVPYQSGSYSVVVTEPSPGFIEVTTKSQFDEAEYQVTSVVGMRYLQGAMIADVPGSIVSYGGTAFTISGLDMNSAGNPGPGPHTHAVSSASQSVASDFKAAIGNNQADNVIGVLGQKDVVRQEYKTDLDALHLFLKANAHPDNVYHGDHKFTGNHQFGTPDNPIIMIVNGNADFSGTVSGYGVLLVEGELQIAAGNVTWEGLVYVNSKDDSMVTHTTADLTGNAQIYGGVIMRLPPGSETTLGFSIKGRAKIQYSTEALARVASLVPQMNDEIEMILLKQWEGQTRFQSES